MWIAIEKLGNGKHLELRHFTSFDIVNQKHLLQYECCVNQNPTITCWIFKPFGINHRIFSILWLFWMSETSAGWIFLWQLVGFWANLQDVPGTRHKSCAGWGKYHHLVTWIYVSNILKNILASYVYHCWSTGMSFLVAMMTTTWMFGVWRVLRCFLPFNEQCLEFSRSSTLKTREKKGYTYPFLCISYLCILTYKRDSMSFKNHGSHSWDLTLPNTAFSKPGNWQLLWLGGISAWDVPSSGCSFAPD